MVPPWLARPGQSGPLRLALGALVSGALLYVALREAELAGVGRRLLASHPGWLAAALGSVALNTAAKALRWRDLLGAGAAPLGRFLAPLLIGQMLNIVIPARLGELSRVALLGQEHGGRLAVSGSIVLEKLLDLACYALLCGLTLALLPLPPWLLGPLRLILLLGGLAGGLFGAALLLGRVQARGRSGSGRWAARLDAGLTAFRALRSPGARGRALGWTALIWATAAFNNLLVLWALPIAAPPLAALALLAVLQAGVSLPSLPATVGVFEGLCVATLALFAVPAELALSYGVLLHLVVLLPPVLGGLLCGWLLGSFGLRRAIA